MDVIYALEALAKKTLSNDQLKQLAKTFPPNIHAAILSKKSSDLRAAIAQKQNFPDAEMVINQ